MVGLSAELFLGHLYCQLQGSGNMLEERVERV